MCVYVLFYCNEALVCIKRLIVWTLNMTIMRYTDNASTPVNMNVHFKRPQRRKLKPLTKIKHDSALLGCDITWKQSKSAEPPNQRTSVGFWFTVLYNRAKLHKQTSRFSKWLLFMELVKGRQHSGDVMPALSACQELSCCVLKITCSCELTLWLIPLIQRGTNVQFRENKSVNTFFTVNKRQNSFLRRAR